MPLQRVAITATDMVLTPMDVANGTTAVSVITVFCKNLEVTNPTASTITFSAADRDSPAGSWIDTQSIYANSMLVYVNATGRMLTKGFTWTASATGLRATGRFDVS